MDTVASRLQETGHQIIKQGDAFVVRTRDAGIAFFGETRQAGTQLFGAVRLEAKRWRKFATQRSVTLPDLRIGFSLPAVEKALLTQVDGTLRALDSRVRSRLAQLDRKGGKKPAKKAAAKAAPNGKKAKAALPPIAA